MVELLPSILSADFAHLADQVAAEAQREKHTQSTWT